MAIKYFDSGVEIDEKSAYGVFYGEVIAQGICEDESQAMWATRATSEEARDWIFEVSRYTLEIVVS